MITNPTLSITLISKLKQNERLRAEFYRIYEDLLGTYSSNKNEGNQLVNNNKESLNILLSDDFVGVVLSLLLEVDSGALKVLPALNASMAEGPSNTLKELKTLAYSGGVPLNSSIDSLGQIGEAAKLYKFNRDIKESYSDSGASQVQAVEDTEELSEEDEAEFEDLINSIRLGLGEADGEDDTQELSSETLNSLASLMATTAKADKTEFDDGDELPSYDELNLDSDDMSYVATTTEAILARYEMMLRPMLELDSPYGILYKDGLSTIDFDKATNSIRFKQGSNKSVFKIIYDEVNKFFGGKLISGNLLNRPTVDNIQSQGGYNYYPAMMLKFALGFANGKRHYNWDSFKKDAKDEITKRVGVLAKAGLFPAMTRKIQESFSNCLLVTTCGNHGSNLIMRVCVANVDINANALADMLKNNPNLSYFNSQIIVEKVGNDVVDIKIIGDMQALLDVPTWAYQALQKQINSGTTLDAYSGLPIGKSFEGDIIKLTFIPSDDFITVLGAGSRSGKGVTTLSILGAALNSGLKPLYNDFKPDMVKCFWDAEKQFPGLHTFAMDGLTSQGRVDKNGKTFSPKSGFPEYASKYRVYGGMMMMLKCIHLMCAVAQYKTEHNDETPLLWVFDEIQAWQTTLCAFAEMLCSIPAPKKNEGESELYDYAQKVLEFIADTDSGMKNYITTTGGKGGVFTLWICQNTDAGAWNNIAVSSGKRKLTLFGAINKAGTMRKILGRGNTIGQYALGGLRGESRFRNQLNYVANNRFFCIFRGSQTDKNTEAEFFKPFLTLNTDDIYDGCWTKGIGKSYGYKPKNSGESDEAYKTRILDKYESTLQTVLPGSNKYGVSSGTGFVGLVGTYCNQDEHTIVSGLASGYEYIDEFMQKNGLSQKYSSIEEYLYDFSESGFPSIGDLQDYTKCESCRGSSEEDGSLGDSGESGDFTFKTEDTGDIGAGATGVGNSSGSAINNDSSEVKTSEVAREPRKLENDWGTFKANINRDRNKSNDVEEARENKVEGDIPEEAIPDTTEANKMFNLLSEKMQDMEKMFESGSEMEEGSELDDLGDGDYTGDEFKVHEDKDLRKALDMQADIKASLKDLARILALTPRANADCDIKGGDMNINNASKEETRDNILKLNASSGVRSETKIGRPTFANAIKAMRGPAYYNKQQFQNILRDLAYSINLKKVRILELTEDNMELDGRTVIISGQYESEYYLPDFIDFKLLLKKLKGLQGIKMSQLMFREMLRRDQLGENAVQEIFRMEPDLLRLVYQDAISGSEVVLDRQAATDVKMQDTINKLKREKELRDMMQEQSLMDSVGSTKDRHYMSRVAKAASSSMGRLKNSPTAMKYAKRTAIAVPTLAIAYAFSPLLLLGGAAVLGIKKLADLGKS